MCRPFMRAHTNYPVDTFRNNDNNARAQWIYKRQPIYIASRRMYSTLRRLAELPDIFYVYSSRRFSKWRAISPRPRRFSNALAQLWNLESRARDVRKREAGKKLRREISALPRNSLCPRERVRSREWPTWQIIVSRIRATLPLLSRQTARWGRTSEERLHQQTDTFPRKRHRAEISAGVVVLAVMLTSVLR